MANFICNAEFKCYLLEKQFEKNVWKNYILYLIKSLNKITIITGEKVLSSGINKITLQLELRCTLMLAFHSLSTCFQEGNLLAVTLQAPGEETAIAKWMRGGLRLRPYFKNF